MPESLELASQDEVAAFLANGLALASYRPVKSEFVGLVGSCLTHFAGSNVGLPAPGFVYDWFHLVLSDEEATRPCDERPVILPRYLQRNYDDYVLAALANDAGLEQIRDVLRKRRRDARAECAVALFDRMVDRLGPIGVDAQPTWVIRSARRMEAKADNEFDQTSAETIAAALAASYTKLIETFRKSKQIITEDDVLEIESASYGLTATDRLMFAQVAEARAELNRSAKVREAPPRHGRRQVPTHLRSEDVYPVGGYESLTYRGPIESLASSQLAYMDDRERPDLFDAKYIRNELLYYSRDEGVFFRPPRSFVFALFEDLGWARFKSPTDRYERTIWALSLPLAACDQLLATLASEKLSFEFALVGSSCAARLAREHRVLQRALSPPPLARIARRTYWGAPEPFWQHLEDLGNRTDCCYLGIGFEAPVVDMDNVQSACLVLGDLSVSLVCGPGGEKMSVAGDWCDALATLLQEWV